MAIIPLPGITAAAKAVLNPWEQTLYNVLLDYFDNDQAKSNRLNILSQVRVAEVIDVNPWRIPTALATVYPNSMSFDILITDTAAKPICIFEADGPHHYTCPLQMNRDNVKDTLAHMAGIPLFRVLVAGELEHLEVVHARANNYPDFSFDIDYPTTNGSVNYSPFYFPRPKPYRVIEAADIELLLIESKWSFPSNWQFATAYDLRDWP